ncbi:MAG: ATP-binding protein [Candidatus Kapaibacteriales bacterium]
MGKKVEIELSRVFTSDNQILSEVEKLLELIKNTFQIDKKKFYEILISITEAVLNAIQHGNKGDPNKRVFLNISADKHNLSVEVADEGEGFNPLTIQDPRTPENITKEHGRGLFIIQSFADSVRIETSKSGTKLKMFFKI